MIQWQFDLPFSGFGGGDSTSFVHRGAPAGFSQVTLLLPPAGGALAEGFHERLREFQMFERTFEVQKQILFPVGPKMTEVNPDM